MAAISISRVVGISLSARFVKKSDSDGYYLKYGGSVPAKAIAILVELEGAHTNSSREYCIDSENNEK